MKGIIAALAAMLFASGLARAQEPGEAEPLPLFRDETILFIRIEAPFQSLFKTAPTSEEAYAGRLVLMQEGAAQAFDVKISPRGLSRRNPQVCQFPPLMVNFVKSQVKGTLFKGQNKIKLVTHCQNYERYQKYPLREFAVYKAYSILTPASFEVRMAEITYRDLDGKNDNVTRYGFFIEDVDDLAERNGLVKLELPQVGKNALQTRQAVIYALFQYMIGNLDWSFTKGPEGSDCCHNSKLLASSKTAPEAGSVLPVPYDFDFSGLVSAPYAVPPEELPVRRVKDRYFRGLCLHNSEIPATIAVFQEKRQQVEAAVAGIEVLEQKERESILKYLAGFYETISDPRKVEKEILRRCRN